MPHEASHPSQPRFFFHPQRMRIAAPGAYSSGKVAHFLPLIAKRNSDPRANIAQDRRRCNSPGSTERSHSLQSFIRPPQVGDVWGQVCFAKLTEDRPTSPSLKAEFYLASVHLAVWQAFSAGDPVEQDDYLGVAGNFLDDFLQLLGHQRRGFFADELAKRYGETRIVKRFAHRCL